MDQQGTDARLWLKSSSSAQLYAGSGTCALDAGAGTLLVVDQTDGINLFGDTVGLHGPATTSGNLTVGGTLSAATWNLTTLSTLTVTGTLSVSAAGALTCSGNFTNYGVTTTINPSGNLNMTASGIYGTAASGPVNFSGSSQVNLACGGTSVNVTATTITNSCVAFKADAVYNVTTGFAANVYVVAGGQMYRSTSTARVKVNIEEVDFDLGDILELQPVTYYDKRQVRELGGTNNASQQVGLIAEQVARTNLGWLLAERDANRLPEAVNYERVGVVALSGLRNLAARVAALEAAR